MSGWLCVRTGWQSGAPPRTAPRWQGTRPWGGGRPPSWGLKLCVPRVERERRLEQAAEEGRSVVVPHGGLPRLLGGRPPPAAEGQVLPPPSSEEGRRKAGRLHDPAVPSLPFPFLSSLSPSLSLPLLRAPTPSHTKIADRITDVLKQQKGLHSVLWGLPWSTGGWPHPWKCPRAPWACFLSVEGR